MDLFARIHYGIFRAMRRGRLMGVHGSYEKDIVNLRVGRFDGCDEYLIIEIINSG